MRGVFLNGVKATGAIALSVVAVQALPAASPTPDASVEDITVTGQRASTLRRLMNDFVLEIDDPVSSSRGYAQRRCLHEKRRPGPPFS